MLKNRYRINFWSSDFAFVQIYLLDFKQTKLLKRYAVEMFHNLKKQTN